MGSKYWTHSLKEVTKRVNKVMSRLKEFMSTPANDLKR